MPVCLVPRIRDVEDETLLYSAILIGAILPETRYQKVKGSNAKLATRRDADGGGT
jgi:hypothetical protein